MSPEPKKRPRRVPFTPEEVANIIAVKRRRELMKLHTFKKSRSYRYQNLFNIACFFVYWEIVFCFFGPASYRRHYTLRVEPQYGDKYNRAGTPIISELDITCVNGDNYKFIINDFIDVPSKRGSFSVATDFLLRKTLKGRLDSPDKDYRLFAASPVLLLIMVTLITSLVAYGYDLNESSYSLMAVTVLNGLTLLAVLCF